MKVYIVQPYYSFDEADLDKCFVDMIAHLESIGDDADVIVLPEYCDVPSATKGKNNFHASIEKYNGVIKEKACAAAKRCRSIVFFNSADPTPTGYRNTTYALDREGKIVGKYYKAHPAPSEVKTEKEGGNQLDVSYSYEFREPDVIEIEGIRFGFMTCYDFYFYENFAPLARKNIDVIIGCSHQRTDTHEALSIINRFLCYNTNAYLVRSSVSLGLDSKICGCSSIIAPNGDVIVDMKSEIGVVSAEIDPHSKYYKAAGFKGALKSHYEYIEEGRRPWLYRNGGASVVPFDKYMPYPRLCAHRGFNSVAPENSQPAFGAAIAMGAQEIEFDVWATKDGHLISLHDAILDRVSDGRGAIWDRELEYFKNCDFGSVYSEKFKGLKGVTFEEILKKFAGRVVMNIHVKIWDRIRISPQTDIDPCLEQIAALIKKYDCEKHVYFMSTNTEMLCKMREILPGAGYCQGAGDGNAAMVEKAIEHGFDKVQFITWDKWDREMVDRCKQHGIKTNICIVNDPADLKDLLDIGIDCIMTDDFQLLKSKFDEIREAKN